MRLPESIPNGTYRSRAKAAIGLLCLMAVTAYLDRYIIALLAQPIARGMGISLTQVGVLIGAGFGVLYATIGVPIAQHLDHGNRVRCVGAGVALWSLGTIASGFAPTYPFLLLARAVVAVGQAVLTPAAISLIADFFPREQRTLPTSLYMGISALMGSGAFIIGGFAYNIATALAPKWGMESWRITLVLVGLPGAALVPIWFLSIREPAREASPHATTDLVAPKAALAYLQANIRFYACLFIGLGISALGIYGYITWISTVLIRSFGLSVADAGFYFGTVGCVAGLAAAIVWPAASNWFTRKGRPDFLIVLLAAALVTGQIAVASISLCHSLSAVLVAIAIASFCFASGGSLPVLALQFATPSALRSRMVSLYILVGNVIGLVFGPALAASLAEHLFSGQDAMRHSLTLVGLTLAPVCGATVLCARTGYAEAFAREAGRR